MLNIVKKRDGYTIEDSNSNNVLRDYCFDQISKYNDNFFVLYDENDFNYGLYHVVSDTLIRPSWKEIKLLGGRLLRVYNGRCYGVISFDGEMVFDVVYDIIKYACDTGCLILLNENGKTEKYRLQ